MDVDITILIANYNKASLLGRAIRSCLGQLILRTNIEIIVIDDCSTDDSLVRLSEFSDNVKILQNDVNMGIGAVSAHGLTIAKGRYFLRVDPDDYLSHSYCLVHKNLLDYNSEFAFSYSDLIEVDEKAIKTKEVSLRDQKVLYQHGAGVMFRTKVLRQIGGYDVSLRNAEDYDLLLRLKKAGYNGFHIPLPLYRYYRQADSLTRRQDRSKFISLVEEKNNV
jgi:GT2 family glycosyltransferase